MFRGKSLGFGVVTSTSGPRFIVYFKWRVPQTDLKMVFGPTPACMWSFSEAWAPVCGASHQSHQDLITRWIHV